jgi:hypothetical protein
MLTIPVIHVDFLERGDVELGIEIARYVHNQLMEPRCGIRSAYMKKYLAGGYL